MLIEKRNMQAYYAFINNQVAKQLTVRKINQILVVNYYYIC